MLGTVACECACKTWADAECRQPHNRKALQKVFGSAEPKLLGFAPQVTLLPVHVLVPSTQYAGFSQS